MKLDKNSCWVRADQNDPLDYTPGTFLLIKNNCTFYANSGIESTISQPPELLSEGVIINNDENGLLAIVLYTLQQLCGPFKIQLLINNVIVWAWSSWEWYKPNEQVH